MDSETGGSREDPFLRGGATDPGRVAAVETEEGDLLVYDAENEDAWIQSDRHCSTDDRR